MYPLLLTENLYKFSIWHEQQLSLILDLLENKHITCEFVYDVVRKIMRYLDVSSNRNEKIINFLPPDKLQKAMDFTLPDHGESIDVICEYVDQILHNVMKTGAAFYFASFFVGSSKRDCGVNRLVLKGHTYLYKPAAFNCRFV